MAKSTYEIILIQKGREKDYRDFWNNDINVNSNGEVLHSDLVGFSNMVEAKSLSEAILLTQKQNPSLSIAREHSRKIG